MASCGTRREAGREGRYRYECTMSFSEAVLVYVLRPRDEFDRDGPAAGNQSTGQSDTLSSDRDPLSGGEDEVPAEGHALPGGRDKMSNQGHSVPRGGDTLS